MAILLLLLLYTVLAYLVLTKATNLSNGLLASIISLYVSISVITLLFVLSIFFHITFWVFVALLFSIVLLALVFYFYKYKVVLKKPGSLNLLPIHIIIGTFIFVFTYRFHFNRWGSWDAWAIWNLHAKFLVAPDISAMFSPEMNWSHSDYPLFLPSIVALFWKSTGIIPVVPALVAYLTALLLPLSSFASLYNRKLHISAIFVLALFLLDTEYITLASYQYADTLLAFTILLAFIAFTHLEKGKNENALISIIGFLVAVCGWIKNEGLLFFAIFTLYFIARNYKRYKVTAFYFLGAFLPLAVIIVFKLIYAPSNEIVSSQDNSIFNKILDFNRYSITLKYFENIIFNTYPILFFMLMFCLIYKVKALISFEFGVLFTLLIGYFAVYIITPFELNWHLSTSCSRLFHQIYPAFIYCMFFKLGKDIFFIKD